MRRGSCEKEGYKARESSLIDIGDGYIEGKNVTED